MLEKTRLHFERIFAYRFSWDKKVRRAWKHTAFEFSKYLDPSTYFIMYSKYIILILSHSDRMTYLHLDNVDIKDTSNILSHELCSFRMEDLLSSKTQQIKGWLLYHSISRPNTISFRYQSISSKVKYVIMFTKLTLFMPFNKIYFAKMKNILHL